MSAPDYSATRARVRRAVASLPGAGRVLVVVGSSDGAAPLASALASVEGISLAVLDLPAIARLVLGDETPARRMATPAERDALWAQVDEPPSLPVSVLRREWDEVIQPQRIGAWSAYLRARRSGQPVVLSNEQKRAAWRVFERIRGGLDERGLWELADLVAAALATPPDRVPAAGRFEAVVLDEPLSLRPPERELLARLSARGAAGVIDASTDPAAPHIDRKALAGRHRRALGSFFGPARAEAQEPSDTEADEEVGQAQLALEAHDEGGGLVLIVPAMAALPASVDRLRVRFEKGAATLLGGNVRSGASRVAVLPSASGYVFEAPAEAWSLGGLPLDRASVFRVREDGHARLTPGRVAAGWVRLLVPPSLGAVELPAGAWSPCEGWRAVEAQVDEASASWLAALGLEVGGASLAVRWAGLPPSAGWGVGSTGERYARFGPGQSPIVSFQARGAAQRMLVVLSGATTEESVEVDGTEGWVELGQLPAGPWVVEVVPEAEGKPERLFFSVEREDPKAPGWSAVLRVGEAEWSLGEDPIVEADLSSVTGAELSLRLPAWTRVSVSWSTTSTRWLGEVWADAEGRVEPSAIGALVGARPEREPVADLELDAGEHGCAVVRHERPWRLDEAVQELRLLIDERRDALGLAVQDVDLFAGLLLVPACESLGYQPVQPVPFAGGSATELGSLVRAGGEVERAPRALAVAVRDRLSSLEPVPAALVSSVRELLARHDAERALVAAGRLWFVVERGRRRPPEVVDLAPALRGEERALVALARMGAA